MAATANVKTSKIEASNIESIVNDAPRFLDTFGAGDVSHQGDLIIVGISRLPQSRKVRKNHQLADGNTQGSRHVICERSEVWDCNPTEVQSLITEATGLEVDTDYIGPVFVSPVDPTENDLSHPEHGNQGFPPVTVCAVVYQRTMDSEERIQRVRD